MRWEVKGADRATGKDLLVILDADDEASARRRADRRGLLVEDARPLEADDSAAGVPAPAVLDYAGPQTPVQAAAVAAADNGERTYLRESDVLVTSARVVIGPTTYALRNVAAVSLVKVPPAARGAGICLVVIAAVVMAVVFAAARSGNVHMDRQYGTLASFALMLVVGVVMTLRPAPWAARVRSNAGTEDLLVGRDHAHIGRVVAAISRAIVERG